MRVSTIRLLRLAFWAALLFAFVMALLPHPPKVPGQPSDKIQHIIAFTMLSVLAAAAYRDTRLLRIGIGLSAFGALIEVAQAIPVLHRDSSAWDWIADNSAIIAVLVIAAFLRRRNRL